MVIANGGSDHILIPGPDAKATAAKVVDILTRLDYVSGVFADDALGDIPGAAASKSSGIIRHFPRRTRFVPGIHTSPPHLGFITDSRTSS